MSEKLKPCPFCGGEAEICETYVTGFHRPFSAVRCINRNVCGILGPSCATEETAIKFWNNRPNPWHTGTPTEEGWYLVVLPICEQVYRYESDYFNKAGKWRLYTNQVIAWQKITPFEEEKQLWI